MPYSLKSVCFTDQQFLDIIRFCAIGHSILNIETTFKLGDFYVSLTSFRNLSLYSPRTKNFPVHVGPIMVHTTKEASNFIYFAHSLERHYVLNKCKFQDSIRNVKRTITDYDESIRNAFKLVFNKCQFMLCCNHLQKDIAREMGKNGFDGITKNKVLEGIFGTSVNRKDSLIGSRNYTAYKNKLDELSIEWKEILNNKSDNFTTYFLKNKAFKIYETVIRPNEEFYQSEQIRDNFMEHYDTTNEIESINHKVKNEKENKNSRYTESRIHNLFHDIAKSQINDVEMALRQAGDYELSEYYDHMKIDPQVWYHLGSNPRQNKIKKVLNEPPYKKDANGETSIKEYLKQKKNEQEKKLRDKKKEKIKSKKFEVKKNRKVVVESDTSSLCEEKKSIERVKEKNANADIKIEKEIVQMTKMKSLVNC